MTSTAAAYLLGTATTPLLWAWYRYSCYVVDRFWESRLHDEKEEDETDLYR